MYLQFHCELCGILTIALWWKKCNTAGGMKQSDLEFCPDSGAFSLFRLGISWLHVVNIDECHEFCF